MIRKDDTIETIDRRTILSCILIGKERHEIEFICGSIIKNRLDF